MTERMLIAVTLVCLVPLTACDDGGPSAMLGESCSANTECLSDYCSEGVCASRTFGPNVSASPLVVEETEAPNTGRMSGPVVGSGDVINANLRRPVTVELLGETYGLTVRSAYVARPRPDSSLTELVARVSNFGDRDVCTPLLYGTAVGDGDTPLASLDASLLGWTLLDTATHRRVQGCLPPGESGYLYDLLSDNFYDDIRAFQVDLAGAWQPETTMPDWTVTPENYAYDPFTSELTLTLSDPGVPDTKYHAFTVLLDDADEPLWVDVETSVFPNNGKLTAIAMTGWQGSTDRVEIVVKAYDD